ncbi:MAG: Crp/Fnr family transcriptional regulator [Burkholderiales bacterium]
MSGKDDRFVLSAEELAAISAHASARAFPRNAVVLNEGDRTDSLYIILEGRVKAFVADADGKEVVLSTQGAGEYFGEMVLDRKPRSASIMTLAPSRFLVVPGEDLRDFVQRNPAFALSLIEKLIQRVRTLTESVKSLAFMDVYGRVARLLLELAEEHDGRLVIGERLTQQDIASRVGASREMVSRILKDLSLCGCITQSRAGIVLHRKPPARW